MIAYCFDCKQFFDISIHEVKERISIKGTHVEVNQKHAYCPQCDDEITPDTITDENILIAHEAYREAIGSIRISDMKKLLEMYKIGASPMSQLLDWGANTYERQMKHTIPDKDHADQLMKLFNPYNMVDLLVKNGDKLSNSTFIKTARATIELIYNITNSSSNSQPTINYCYKEKPISNIGELSVEKSSSETSFTVSYSTSPQSSIAYSSPFDLPVAA